MDSIVPIVTIATMLLYHRVALCLKLNVSGVIFYCVKFIPDFRFFWDRQNIGMPGLKLHFLIDLKLFLFWDCGVPHELVLLPEVNIIFVQLSVVVPEQTLKVISRELLLLNLVF